MLKRIYPYRTYGEGYPYDAIVCDKCENEICPTDDEGDPVYDYDTQKVYELNGQHYCEECYKNTIGFYDTLNLESAEKYGDEEPVSVMINGFYAYLLSTDEINEALHKVVMELGIIPETVQDYINDTEIETDDWMYVAKGE